MTLALYTHPLASYCHKVLIALYENATPFEPRRIDLANDADSARFLALWPVGKMPVLRDDARDRTIPETSIILEYLEQHYPGLSPLLPDDPELRLEARLLDRFFDLYVSAPMQKIVLDRLRPAGASDPHGVAEARANLAMAYGMIEARMRGRQWAIGDQFSIADCAAAPALFFAGILEPFPPDHASLAAYFTRLEQRPSFARVLMEARPYFASFPFHEQMPERFR